MSIFNRNKNLNNQLINEINKYKELNKILTDKIQSFNNIKTTDFLNSNFSNLSNEWKQILINQYEHDLENLKKSANQKMRNFLWEALSSISIDSYKEDYIYKVKCNNDEIKSRLIGLNGRNKKCFEKTCGLELIVNKNDDEIKISCTNLVKKELASRLLNKLINTKNIEQNKIKNYYNAIVDEFEDELFNLGKTIIEEKLNIHDFPSNIYKHIGMMKYRMSYGQNLLEHSLECAEIARKIAIELNLDPMLAIKCAFLHDFGKVLETEFSTKNHVELAVEWTSINVFDPIIVNSIEAHHGNVPATSIYASITKFVDEISASREGARTNSKDSFIERVKEYEKICYSFPEVKDCWVLNTGFLIKIIVTPNLVKDDELELLGIRIKKAFEQNKITKMYNITLELIKENTFKIKTEKKV